MVQGTTDRRKKGSAENSAVTLPSTKGGGILFFFDIPLRGESSSEIPLEDRMGVRGNFTKRDIALYSVLNRRILRTTLFLPVRDSGVIEMINERFLPEASHRENGRTIVRETKRSKKNIKTLAHLEIDHAFF